MRAGRWQSSPCVFMPSPSVGVQISFSKGCRSHIGGGSHDLIWAQLPLLSPYLHSVTNGRISFTLGPSSMPLHMYITSALSIHPSTGTRVVSLSWLLQIMSQCSWEWTFVGTVRSEIHQTEKDKYCMAFLTCVESKKAQLMEIEGRMMATRSEGPVWTALTFQGRNYFIRAASLVPEQCPTSDRNPVSTLWLTDEVTYDLTVTANIFKGIDRGKKLREHHFNTRYRALCGWWEFWPGQPQLVDKERVMQQ